MRPIRLPCSRRPVRLRCQSTTERLRRLEEKFLHNSTSRRQPTLKDTDLKVGAKSRGKVRDVYDIGSALVIVTTDRLSAFDRYLTTIPFKGQVLNQTSAWWFEQTSHLVPNGVIDVPDPNVTIMKKVQVFPVEFVVRGYMTGSTQTSLWTHYAAGERSFSGIEFPEGLRKNDPLDRPVITPTSKSDEHDVPLTPEEIVQGNYMTVDDWETVSAFALELFAFGQAEAAKNNLILVDTKYEFGRDADGNILLVDEVHTPDSSRFWMRSSYERRRSAGQEPESIDKEFIRLWYAQHCDPYTDKVLPEAPAHLISSLSARYVFLYETMTGKRFVYHALQQDEIHHRILSHVKK